MQIHELPTGTIGDTEYSPIDNGTSNRKITLDAIGKKRGALMARAEVDYDKVYSVVMNDIKNGMIKGITFDRYE